MDPDLDQQALDAVRFGSGKKLCRSDRIWIHYTSANTVSTVFIFIGISVAVLALCTELQYLNFYFLQNLPPLNISVNIGMIRAFFKILFCGLVAYVAHFLFLREVWIRTLRAAIASRRATVPIALSCIFSLNHITSFHGVYTLFRRKLWSRVRIMLPRICLAIARQLRPGSQWPSRCSRSRQPL